MNLSRSLKTTAVAIGLLVIPVVGISAIPNQNSAPLNTGLSQRTEGDSNPWPIPTLTRYMPGPTVTVTAAPKANATHSPAPAVTRYVPVPARTVRVPGPTHTRVVQTPGPTVTVTMAPSR